MDIEQEQLTEENYLERLGEVAGVTPEQQADFLTREFPEKVEQLFKFLKELTDQDEFLAKILLITALTPFCAENYQPLDRYIIRLGPSMCAELIQLVHMFRNLKEVPEEERLNHIKGALLVSGFTLPKETFQS